MADNTTSKETVILDFQVDTGDAVKSIGNLTKANKELRDERKNLDLSTKEGKARINEINAALDENNKTIKENSSALEKSRLNVGNYTGALDKMVPGLGATIDGFTGMAKSALAFIATPIGAILAVLTVVLGTVAAAFKKMEPVLDFFENIITQITVGVNVFLANIEKVGAIIGNVLTGNLSEAAKQFNELADAIGSAATQAQLYLDLSRDLEDDQVRFRKATADTENQIQALIIASKNRSISLQEQAKLLQEAADLEEKLVKGKEDLARREAVIGIKKLALDRDIRQSADETFEQFVDRLIESEKLSGEEKNQIVDLWEKQKMVASESLAFQEKVQNQKDAIAQKAHDLELKRLEDRKKAEEKFHAESLKNVQDSEKQMLDILADSKAREDKLEALKQKNRDAARKKENEAIQEQNQQIDDAAQAEFDKEIQRIKDLEAARNASFKFISDLSKASLDLALGQIKNELDTVKKAENDKVLTVQASYAEKQQALDDQLEKGIISQEVYDDSTKALLTKRTAEEQKIKDKAAKEEFELKKKAFEANKKNQIVQSTIDMVQSALAAFRSLIGIPIVGPVLAPIAAAAAVIFGTQKINQIQQSQFVPFKKGGYTGDGDVNQIAGVTHGQEFVMPAPIVAKYGKEHFQSYMDGTVVANSMTKGMGASSGQNMQPIYVSWKEFTEFRDRQDVKKAVVTA